MILLSNGGANTFRSDEACDRLIVGTVDGIFVLVRERSEWNVASRALEGCYVSAVTQLSSGTLIAATHGVGVARSTDAGRTWDWVNTGITHLDLWAAGSGTLQRRDVVLVGSLPTHVFISEDDGLTWRDLPALKRVPSASQWFFPPPPRIGHVKNIVVAEDRLYVGIEIGALLVSRDFGESFDDLHVEADPRESDIHRLLVNPRSPEKMIAAVGLVGLVRTVDGGASWTRDPILPDMEYPDGFVMHPDEPDTLFLAAGSGWPNTWYRRKRAQGRIGRSRDGGATWERLLGGLPDGQRSLFSALSLLAYRDGFDLFAVDTDGQVFESRDGGDRWTMIADIAPVSKGEFHRALAKDRPRIASVDDVKVSGAAAVRLGATSGQIG